MKSKIALCALTLALALAAAPAFADMATDVGRPEFSDADRAVIARNVSLAAALKTQPWAVRRVLDELAEVDAQEATMPAAGAPPPDGSRAGGTDPDLNRLMHASPEAAHDLIQIIKQAASGDGGLARNAPAPPAGD